MNTPYCFLPDVAAAIEPPQDGTLSRTLHQDEQLKVVVFGFSAGQELSQHTSATPAVLHVLRGEARIGLGDDIIAATAGAWVHMPAQLPHSIRAETPVVMLLMLLKQPQKP